MQPVTSDLPGCRFAWTTRRMDRGTTGMDDKTGGFRGGSISHPGRQVTLSLYLATVRSHCSSGVRGSFILPLHYTSVGPVHNAQVCYIPR